MASKYLKWNNPKAEIFLKRRTGFTFKTVFSTLDKQVSYSIEKIVYCLAFLLFLLTNKRKWYYRMYYESFMA